MQHKLLKYILDIERIIQEIEKIKQLTQNNFNTFRSEILYQRAGKNAHTDHLKTV
jgi:hypothetical protein